MIDIDWHYKTDKCRGVTSRILVKQKYTMEYWRKYLKSIKHTEELTGVLPPTTVL